ncbi:MAG: response regulator [Melioribacteraceae bacterium]|nr:response regulator [Melioribacteraceae bacterium]MCF8354734.1 response regulator [Melioribacteraceae bacterium]MCF8393244.1 response regulator [Melioribacteraceae bacterium]MCF8417545.1 response regulator [Melioribacteraceae bacterium]
MAEDTEKKPKLLVVEDDYENQKFLQIFLKRKFKLEICDSSDTFYEKLKEQDFDIILMDISLRGKKDGLQLTRELREMPKYKDLPIVGLSAHAFQRDKDNAYNAGVNQFLTKPVQNDVLMDTLVNEYEKHSKKD